jgi:hypothetical protein
MKAFLSTCIALMIAAGIYGAADMTHDLKNGDLIDYENVRQRHAQSILFIIKTTGLGTYKFRGSGAGKERVIRPETVKEQKVTGKEVHQYLEEFSRGDEG